MKDKIIYISYVDLENTSGYNHKIEHQVKALSKTKFEVYLLARYGKKRIAFIKLENNKLKIIKKFSPEKEYKNKYLFHYFFNKQYFKIFLDLDKEYKFDYYYIRRIIPVTSAMLKALKKLRKENKIIFYEIPTFPWKEEAKKNFNKISYCMDVLSYGKLLKLVDYVPAIYNDSARLSKIEKKKFIKISNGISAENIKLKSNKKNDNAINFVSIAFIAKWHGYDRIIKGLYEYYKTNPEKEIYYHCVGEGSDLENLKTLVRELSLEKYVIFHGIKTGEDLDKVVDECDIAFGSLANHRKKLYADSSLKNREYCARGIPFVIASDDPDFPETFPFVYRIPKDDTPVDVSQVIKWHENLIKEHPNYSMEMRRYAEENLSWDAKMKPVIEKIKELGKLKERKQNT